MDLLSNMQILADICSNHHGSLELFKEINAQIGAAGAILKIQLWSPETFPHNWLNLLEPNSFIPSVFRLSDVDMIAPYRPLALKIASVENTYFELIERCMQHPLPLIISTGGMDEEDLLQLIDVISPHQHGLSLLHCISNYPTKKEDLNLGRILSLSEVVEESDIDCELGWSSHHPFVNHEAITMAYCFGCTIFEFHVRHPLHTTGTLDEQCAFTPSQIKQMRTILEGLHVIEGSDEIAGPDRDFVVKHRVRWQTARGQGVEEG